MTDRAILKIGRQVILVADHTKFGRVSTVMLAPIEQVDTLVTDAQVSPEDLAAFAARGIRVIVA
jgi:DeoR/GlpR family transcriptional regulator of sugar metabolism